MKQQFKVVMEWHEALNAKAYDEVEALVHDQVKMSGPRGELTGANEIRDWMQRANVQFSPLRSFSQGNHIVIEEIGTWIDSETNEVKGQQKVSVAFEVKGSLIIRIDRYDDLQIALKKVGLTVKDEIQLDNQCLDWE